MDTKVFKKKQLVFRQGETGHEMYDILYGSVGIYLNYGTPQEKLLTTLYTEAQFGEMALLDETVRSATAVALEDGTRLAVITVKDFSSYFESRPGKLLEIMQNLSKRLRELTRDYLIACGTVTEAARDMENGKAYAPELAERLRYYAQQGKA